MHTTCHTKVRWAPTVWTWLFRTRAIPSLQVFMLLPVVQTISLIFFSVLLFVLQTLDVHSYSLPTGGGTLFIASITTHWHFKVMFFKPWNYLVIILTVSQTNFKYLFFHYHFQGKQHLSASPIITLWSSCQAPNWKQSCHTCLTTSCKQSTCCITPQLSSSFYIHLFHGEMAVLMTNKSSVENYTLPYLFPYK